MQPRLGPPQRGHTKPSGQRCRLNCSPHCCSSPNCARNSCTVSILVRDLLPDFFIEITISPYLRLSKMDIHLMTFVPACYFGGSPHRSGSDGGVLIRIARHSKTLPVWRFAGRVLGLQAGSGYTGDSASRK